MPDDIRLYASSNLGSHYSYPRWFCLIKMMMRLRPVNRGQRMKPQGYSSRQNRKVVVLITILLLSAAFMASCTQAGSGPSPARANVPQNIPVTVALVHQQDLPIYLNGLGSVTAYYTVNVRSRVDGQLVEVRFR